MPLSPPVNPALAPLAGAGWKTEDGGRRWIFHNEDRRTTWSLSWMEAADDPDEATLACRVTHDDIDGDQTLYVTLGGFDPTERANVVLVVVEIANVLDADNYDAALRPLLHSGLEVMYRDGWLKLSMSKADLTTEAIARRTAFVASCRAHGFDDTAGYDAMFDGGIAVSPEARAEKHTADGVLTLDYYVHRDFLEVVFRREDDDRRVGIRAFGPRDVEAAVRACATLASGAGAAAIADAVRALVACCRSAAIETPQGWRTMDRDASLPN